MRKFLISSIVAPGLLLSPGLWLSVNAAAQNLPPRYEGFRSDFRDNQLLFSRVRADLDRAENNVSPDFGNTRQRFDRVRGELSELQLQWDENRYDPAQADTVIVTLQRVLRDNYLLPRDRDRLMDDISRLRDFRDSHE
jgi:hypothetical protein